ncbi:hypothetical protein MuYL_0779 [Mucilaginibacter xinganensis]|uniref:Uncharacterized protein n=1 Tax=Mucilaginibacter xinganensis TaxID=1234841 RepID=A0A223NS01_9SPHI|nr:hypothetical protein MuYL_0779 [Mucilaginibacter xinganensis]
MGVNRFYCCGKLASITLIYGVDENAGSDAAKKDNCCKNEKQSFKIKDNHVSANSFVFIPLLPVTLPSLTGWKPIASIKDQIISIGYQSNAPPGSCDTPIYTRNCTYRI